ncbi:hypothetical protein [Flavobacterium aurantiibacter]|uniref:hypothetical protein n=1 Tax=Flavobacterium aurantiibacter TaxID=2023067 RepID=UPI00105518CB|nr:hypothetical protein [Flavobacterium aurantiibacter]
MKTIRRGTDGSGKLCPRKRRENPNGKATTRALAVWCFELRWLGKLETNSRFAAQIKIQIPKISLILRFLTFAA